MEDSLFSNNEEKMLLEAKFMKIITTSEFLRAVNNWFSQSFSEDCSLAFKNYMLGIPQPETRITRFLKKYLFDEECACEFYHYVLYENIDEIFFKLDVIALIQAKLI